MMTNLNNNDVRIAKTDDFSLDAFEMEADMLANEILGELDLKDAIRPKRQSGSLSIKVGPANSDILNHDEMDLQKVARLRRMIRRGEYKVDPQAIAAALMLSGDLDR